MADLPILTLTPNRPHRVLFGHPWIFRTELAAGDRPEDILSTPRVVRVTNLGQDGVDLKIAGDVRVFTQWELTGELRRRIQKRFDAEGIEIPYHREVQVPFGGPPGARTGKRSATPDEAVQPQHPD